MKNGRGELGETPVVSNAKGSSEHTPKSLPNTSTDSFSAVLAWIASLPLSDGEKAEAVRRLMAERDGFAR